MKINQTLKHPENADERHHGRVQRSVQPSFMRYTDIATASNVPTPVYQSAESESGSDDYVGARRNIPTKQQKRRNRLVAAGQLPPSHAEVRFSSRRSKQVTNYNEEEEDNFEEDEDENMTPDQSWGATVEYTGPHIDKVLDHRPKDGIGMLSQAR